MKNNKLTKEIYNFATALVFMLPYALHIFNTGYNFALGGYIYILMLGLCIASCIFIQNRMPKVVLVVFGYFTILYFYSSITHNLNDYSYLNMITYVIMPIILANQTKEEPDYERILELTIYISLIGIPVLYRLLDLKYIKIQQINMAYAYSMSISVCATILLIFYYKKKNTLLIIGYIYNSFILFQILILGNRGVYLSILTLLLLMQVYYASSKSISKIKRRTWFLLIISEVVAGILIVTNLEVIVNGLYDFVLSRMKTVPSILIKMKYLFSIGEGIGNHRDDVYSLAISYILRNPLGKGIDTLYWLTNKSVRYSNNFILALLLDCGCIFGGLIVFFSMYPIYELVKNRKLIDRAEFGFLIFAIAISIPKVSVSGNIWLQSHFWFVVGMGYNMWKKRVKEHRSVHTNKIGLYK